MLLLSPRMIRFIEWTTNYCYFLKVIPYIWDEKTLQVSLTRSRFALSTWYFVGILSQLHQCLLVLRFCQILSENTDSFHLLVMRGAFVIALFIPKVLQIIYLLHKDEIALFYNRFISYTRKIDCQYAKETDAVASHIQLCEVMMAASVLLTLFLPTSVLVFFMFDPDLILHITSLIPAGRDQGPWSLLAGIVTIWIILYGLAIVLIAICDLAPYVFISIFLTSELKVTSSLSPFTSDSLRRPAAALHTYRCLKVLEVSANANIRETAFFTVLNNSILALSVLCNFCLVRFSHTNPPIVVSILISLSIFGTAAIILLHIVLGRFNDVSIEFINSWKRRRDIRYSERKVLLRLMRSCRSLRLEIGSFGYFKKNTTFLVVGKLVFYTTKLLVLTKTKSSPT